jgi:hypothetical protein
MAGGTHFYAYVGGNPIRYIDPLGLGKWDNFYGLPKDFWRWLHREDGGKLIKELKDETGQVPKDMADKWHDIWKKEKEGGWVDPELLEWLIPWWLYSPGTGGCDASGRCSDTRPRISDLVCPR